MTTKASRRCRTGPSNTGGHGRSFDVAFASSWTKAAPPTGVLAYWAATVAVGRTPPRHNANEDRDWRVLAVVNVLVRHGNTERAAVHMVAPEINKSPEAVYSILRKIRQGPFVKKTRQTST